MSPNENEQFTHIGIKNLAEHSTTTNRPLVGIRAVASPCMANRGRSSRRVSKSRMLVGGHVNEIDILHEPWENTSGKSVNNSVQDCLVKDRAID